MTVFLGYCYASELSVAYLMLQTDNDFKCGAASLMTYCIEMSRCEIA